MTLSKPPAIWCKQCEAAHRIKERYGLNAALDYLVAEKLFNHATAAAQNAEFARELPGFVAEVRRMFELHEIANYLAQMERRDREEELADLADDEDDSFAETASELAARKQRSALIKELLTPVAAGNRVGAFAARWRNPLESDRRVAEAECRPDRDVVDRVNWLPAF